MNTMHVEGFNAKIEYDEELDLFRGEILGLNGSVDFYGKNPKELRAEFKKSLQVFLDVCQEKGIGTIDIRNEKLVFRCRVSGMIRNPKSETRNPIPETRYSLITIDSQENCFFKTGSCDLMPVKYPSEKIENKPNKSQMVTPKKPFD